MTDRREQPTELVAVIRNEAVLVEPGANGPRLPRVARTDGVPTPVRLLAHAGASAVLAAPRRMVEGNPRLTVDLVSESTTGTDDARTDGTWLPLADLGRLDEVSEVARVVARGWAEWQGELRRPSKRPAWYSPGWYEEADTWVDEQLDRRGRRRSGPSEPVKVWSLSAVVRTPTVTDAGLPRDDVYLKAPCEWFRSEPAFTQALTTLTPEHLPTVLAVDHERAWMLMAAVAGAGAEPPPSAGAPAARALAQIQIDLLPHLSDLRAAGLPDRTLAPTLAGLTDLVTASVELDQLSDADRADLASMTPWLVEQLEEFASLAVPYSIGHGDCHIGNVAVDGESLVIYDWTDASVTFPFLDAILLADSTGAEHRDDVLAAYADVWSGVCAPDQVEAMLDRTTLVNDVFQAISYEGIYRSREVDSLWEMRGVVAWKLGHLLAAWRAATGRREHGSD